MPIKVLIVLDGRYRFQDGAMPAGTQDFTYSTLVNALLAERDIEVTTAHRGADSSADRDGFSFAPMADPLGSDLLRFDMIWLIGWEGRNAPARPEPTRMEGLGAAQLNAIARFMDEGGGVFATGDHDSVGAEMSGQIPRVRAMRCWFGRDDMGRPADLADLPANFPPLTAARADTTRPNLAGGVYTERPAPFVWFENQSDSVPQPMTPTTRPAHPILRRNGADIRVFPDHMHEGMTLGLVPGYDYSRPSPFGDTSKPEFREIAGHREPPVVIATGEVLSTANYTAAGSGTTEPLPSDPKTINLLSVYDGRVAGVGRVVTGSTFHHYIDINLTGDRNVVLGTTATRVGPDARKDHGFNDNLAVFDDIKAVFVNITRWLARPPRTIGLILERSTFSEAEVGTGGEFAGAILLTVDGLKPSQFPGSGIPALGPISGSPPWVPTIEAVGAPISIEPMSVSSDDPGMPDRLQRFTFTYRVRIPRSAFDFDGSRTVPVRAALNSPERSIALTDTAWLQLVRSADPFMLDLADGNDTTWLSSDVKVFHVVAGEEFLGLRLPADATRDDTLAFVQSLTRISSAQFSDLRPTQEVATLSSLEMTTGERSRRVYNFALARVRVSRARADAEGVRVFFRIFTTLTTAALTYRLGSGGMPTDGYPRTDGADPVALPGTDTGGNAWVSFPFFAEARSTPQHDLANVKRVPADPGYATFGALIDNNLPGAYLTRTPRPVGDPRPLSELMMGEHQCIVAQIEYGGTPIPDGATPWTSDKLAQRNIAISPVANPGLDPSRVAMHTFEIEATPNPIGDVFPPDELLLDWSGDTPAGTMLRIHIPSWTAREVVELADRFYPRHEIEAIDEHTVEIPGGGTRYLPIPASGQRQTGVIAVECPLGIKKGQRLDVSVRQVTNRVRNVQVPSPKIEEISLEEADRILANLPQRPDDEAGPVRAVDLGDNKVLITDLSLIDAVSDRALIVEHPDPRIVEAARRESARWREPIGAFQLGVPVSTREEMLLYHMRLLSVMRWRTAQLARNDRWRRTMVYYLDLLAAKVAALGGDPFAIPATPDGAIPQLSEEHGSRGGGNSGRGGTSGRTEVGEALQVLLTALIRKPGCWLMILLMILLALLLWYLFGRAI